MDDEQLPPAQAVTIHLDGAPGSTATARHRTQDFLTQLVPAVSTLLARDAVLVVAELVANAVRHAPGPCTVDLLHSGHRLVIAVTDTSTELPVRRDPDLVNGSGGFGMNLLDRVAADITVRPHRRGKTATVTLDIPRS